MKRLLQTAAEAWLLLLTFLLPLKFGVFSVMPEATSFFPGDVFSLLVINWPATSFGLLTAPGLLLCLAAFPAGSGRVKTAGWLFGILWSAGLVLGALPGLCKISTWEFAVLQVNHFCSIGCYGLAVYLAAAESPAVRKHLTTALGAGFLLTVWLGIEQYFWGFARSRAFLDQQIASGVEVGEVLQARTDDDRVFATFTSCNSLAGYLLLLTPLITVWAWDLGKKVEPVRVSRNLFAGIAGGGGLAVFLLTKSRAGFLALALTAVLILFVFPMKRWKKAVLLGGIACVMLIGTWYIHAHGRGFLSMTARADYLRSSAILLADSPVTGCGWGEFFFEHVRIKKVQDKEAAHDPHNLLATQAQAGGAAVLIALAGMAVPFLVWFRRRKRGELTVEDRAIVIGMTGFLLHAMMDIDMQIPGLMACYFAAGALFLCRDADAAIPCRKWGMVPVIVWGVLLAGWTLYTSNRELQGEIALDHLQSLTRLRNLPPEERAAVTPERVNRALLTAVAARPYSSQPWSAAGDYYFSIGDLDQADVLYVEALRRSPKRAGLYALRARIAFLRQDQAKAAELLKKAAGLFPHHPGYKVLP